MSRQMVVITESGTATSLAWWACLRVEGRSVVVAGSLETNLSLVVAALPSEAEAKGMFTAINQRVLLKARTFDAREWSAFACDQVHKDPVEGE